MTRSGNFFDIIDAKSLREDLTALANNTRGGDTALRKAVLERLKQVLADGRDTGPGIGWKTMAMAAPVPNISPGLRTS